MATNWTAVTGNDIYQVLSRKLVADANENTAADVVAGQTLDPSAQNRAGQLVDGAVDELRSAIRNGGRIPLSLTASTVPPECVIHVLHRAAWRLLSSTPNLNAAILSEGMRAGLKALYDEAEKHYGEVRRGQTVTEPSDPTGRDYATAVDADPTSDTYNPAVSGVSWGDTHGTMDEYAAGSATDEDGVVTGLPLDMKLSI